MKLIFLLIHISMNKKKEEENIKKVGSCHFSLWNKKKTLEELKT